MGPWSPGQATILFFVFPFPIIGPPVTQGQLSDGIQNKLCNFGASCGKTRRWSEDVDVVELE